MAGGIRKKLTGVLLRFAGEHIALGNALRFAKNACLAARYRAGTLFCRTDKKMVVFCSFEGRSYSDSPRALFEYMVCSGKFTGYTFIWAFRGDPAVYRGKLRKRLKELSVCGSMDRRPRICVVSCNSAAWRMALGCAGYWILNYKVKDYLKPRKDQVFVQCWHGTPLKRLGYDVTHFDNPLNTAEGLAKHYGIEVKKFSYFLSPSPFATEKFRSAWRMEDCGKSDVILEEGYPRNDILTNYTARDVQRIWKDVFGSLPRMNGRIAAPDGRKKVILYAPTYRQSQNEGTAYTYKLPFDPDILRNALGDDFVILFRAHYLIANQIDFAAYKGFIYDVSSVDDVSDLYLITDILVTDYSSSLFDFAILKRPMIFYMYDLEYYRDRSNGFYFDPQKVLPGPIVKTQQQLIAAVRAIQEAPDAAQKASYEHFRSTFNPHEDGQVCARVTEAVFSGK